MRLVELLAHALAAANLTAPEPWMGGQLYLHPDLMQSNWSWPRGVKELEPWSEGLQYALHTYVESERRPRPEEVMLFRDGMGWTWHEVRADRE